MDEKSRQVFLTEDGHQKVEELMLGRGCSTEDDSLYDAANIRLMHHLTAALRAHALFRKDVEYIVRNGEVIIVDEFTGRTMPGRRWSDGLHQAVEAKEGVRVREENQTVASITFQNYFRLYEKLSGMTGTADTEAFEFQQIYGLEVVVIPTHRPMIRNDQADLVYLTQKDKFEAIIEDIKDCREREQPVLVGTTSIETSEYLAGLLEKDGVTHQVLNAKQHEREAHVVAEAGRPGAVTIATNMAGRGTDIVLGGNLEAELSQLDPAATDADRQAHRAGWQERHDQVIAAGGLRIIGTERHESRRIDNQLRGRSGRQGDPGSSRFYLSIEDNLMRIFGDPERTKGMLRGVGMREGEAIESNLLTGQIERAQRKVEAPQLRCAQVTAGIRRRGQRPAPRHLPAAQPADADRRHLRGPRRDPGRGGQCGHQRVHCPRECRGAVGRGRPVGRAGEGVRCHTGRASAWWMTSPALMRRAFARGSWPRWKRAT